MPSALPAAAEPALLRDGAAVDLRLTTRDDLDALTAFHEALSDSSRLFRFLSLGLELRGTLAPLVEPDVTGLVAVVGGRIVGHGCLAPIDAERAELAFAVADAWQHRGIATVLLERLLALAADRGLATLTAEVHPGNRRMLEVFRDIGVPVVTRADADGVHLELAAGVTPEAARRFAERHRRAALAGLDHVLRPASVAVIGASERRGSPGGELLRNVLAGGYRGRLHVVHPRAATIAGVPAVRRARDLPAGIDLGVIAVPAASVVRAARDCAAAGVRALVVVSAGFGEAGSAGRRRQERLLDVCREAGMRLVGPNCLGVVNTAPAVALNATFAPQRVPAGGIALASQSGAVGIMAMDLAARRGVGLSSFVSLGDRADVSSNDLLRCWAEDPRTTVVALYLESFGNPRAFAAVAREVARVKPVVAVKAGRTAAGRRAAASHTGAMVEGSDALADALLAEAGVIRVDTVGELLDVATVLDRAGLPSGPRIGVLTNAGGAGIACADAAEAAGLVLPRLGKATRARVRATRPAATLANPVDLLADATADDYAGALGALADDPRVDAVVALHVPPLAGREDTTMEGVGAAAAALRVPVVAVPLAQDVPAGLPRQAAVLATPEDAARALGRVARHRAWLGTPDAADAPPARIDRLAAAAIVARALRDGPGWMDPGAAAELATAYGIPLAPGRVAADADDVAARAAELGGPVAVKAIAPGLSHKTEHGAVALGLGEPGAAASAARRLASRLAADGFDVRGFLVQQMVSGGVELLVGAVSDPTFGPVVACGAGGTTAELWHDIQVRLAPVSRRTAADMIRALHCFPLLSGWRGAPRARLGAVEDVVRRMAALAADRPEIAEVECNPLLAGPAGAVAVDLRVRLVAP
jgi:acyl-CoA synthetase (NDP forming)/GNAT superfamily N-acetyltransferase